MVYVVVINYNVISSSSSIITISQLATDWVSLVTRFVSVSDQL